MQRGHETPYGGNVSGTEKLYLMSKVTCPPRHRIHVTPGFLGNVILLGYDLIHAGCGFVRPDFGLFKGPFFCTFHMSAMIKVEGQHHLAHDSEAKCVHNMEQKLNAERKKKCREKKKVETECRRCPKVQRNDPLRCGGPCEAHALFTCGP